MAPGDIFNLTGATPPFPDSGPGVAEVGGGVGQGSCACRGPDRASITFPPDSLK